MPSLFGSARLPGLPAPGAADPRIDGLRGGLRGGAAERGAAAVGDGGKRMAGAPGGRLQAGTEDLVGGGGGARVGGGEHGAGWGEGCYQAAQFWFGGKGDVRVRH